MSDPKDNKKILNLHRRKAKYSFFSLGMVAQEVQQMLKSGVRSHFSDLFNVLDFMLLEGYIGALSLFYWTMQKSKVALTELNGKNLTSLLQHSNDTNIHLYWLNTGEHNLNDILSIGLIQVNMIHSLSICQWLGRINK